MLSSMYTTAVQPANQPGVFLRSSPFILLFFPQFCFVLLLNSASPIFLSLRVLPSFLCSSLYGVGTEPNVTGANYRPIKPALDD